MSEPHRRGLSAESETGMAAAATAGERSVFPCAISRCWEKAVCPCRVAAVAAVWGVFATSTVADTLPAVSDRLPVPAPHLPTTVHAFVWRNWETIALERMAEVLGTDAGSVRAMGESMGLPPHVAMNDQQRQRSYISVIRRNWHLLPYEQLLTLLGWDAERLAYTLKEDDFLEVKVGTKPNCPPLRYVQPDDAVKRRCAEIKRLVESQFGEALGKPGEPRFAFVDRLAAPAPGSPPAAPGGGGESIRFLYSYFAVYGDPLLNPELDPYPEGLLERLAARGVNGVWLHTLLRQLAPSKTFPEFGEGHETRLANLRKLVDRAAKHGIKIYLYMNEPRAMPASFFANRPQMKGIEELGHYAMCTSAPEVRQWMTDALRYVFEQVPGLGGVFTITASENLTNCYSRGKVEQCPRCSKRAAVEVLAEVHEAIAAGVHQGNPDAKVIIWDWGWHGSWVEGLIKRLPQDVYLMSVSEWSKPIHRGGVSTAIGEYSISAVGPGPRATRHWALARERGLKTMAKVQVNCTWELSAVPCLPVMNLIAQHCDNLNRAGIDGMMLSWTLGGYPSANLELVSRLSARPAPSIEEALRGLASSRYGGEAVPHALQAWSAFSSAFEEYPFHVGFVYGGPAQVGPANLLYVEPTGYPATMVGFPFDDVKGWSAVYPPEVTAGQFEKIAGGWQGGLDALGSVMDHADTPTGKANAEEDRRVAEAAWLHFRSVANQIRFTLARDGLQSSGASGGGQDAHRQAIQKAAREEMKIARRLFDLTREDSRIGFEASNHYYYFPLDLVEKVVNCEHVLDRFRK